MPARGQGVKEKEPRKGGAPVAVKRTRSKPLDAAAVAVPAGGDAAAVGAPSAAAARTPAAAPVAAAATPTPSSVKKPGVKGTPTSTKTVQPPKGAEATQPATSLLSEKVLLWLSLVGIHYSEGEDAANGYARLRCGSLLLEAVAVLDAKWDLLYRVRTSPSAPALEERGRPPPTVPNLENHFLLRYGRGVGQEVTVYCLDEPLVRYMNWKVLSIVFDEFGLELPDGVLCSLMAGDATTAGELLSEILEVDFRRSESWSSKLGQPAMMKPTGSRPLREEGGGEDDAGTGIPVPPALEPRRAAPAEEGGDNKDDADVRRDGGGRADPAADTDADAGIDADIDAEEHPTEHGGDEPVQAEPAGYHAVGPKEEEEEEEDNAAADAAPLHAPADDADPDPASDADAAAADLSRDDTEAFEGHSAVLARDYPVGCNVDLADGRSGAVTGTARGRVGVDVGDGVVVGVLPDGVTRVDATAADLSRDDTEYLEACSAALARDYPVGCRVALADGRSGVVTGTARGRVGVDVEGGEIVGVLPDVLKKTDALKAGGDAGAGDLCRDDTEAFEAHSAVLARDYPVGCSVTLADGRSGAVTGTARGRVGVDVGDGVVVGVVPQNLTRNADGDGTGASTEPALPSAAEAATQRASADPVTADGLLGGLGDDDAAADLSHDDTEAVEASSAALARDYPVGCKVALADGRSGTVTGTARGRIGVDVGNGVVVGVLPDGVTRVDADTGEMCRDDTEYLEACSAALARDYPVGCRVTLADGRVGVVTGTARGRIGIQFDADGGLVGMLPDGVRRVDPAHTDDAADLSRDDTEAFEGHSAVLARDYPVGCNVDLADGRSGAVTGTARGRVGVDVGDGVVVGVLPDGVTRVDATAADLSRDDTEYLEACSAALARDYPVGCRVALADGRSGVVTGTARGRVGVDVEGGEIVGVLPDVLEKKVVVDTEAGGVAAAGPVTPHRAHKSSATPRPLDPEAIVTEAAASAAGDGDTTLPRASENDSHHGCVGTPGSQAGVPTAADGAAHDGGGIGPSEGAGEEDPAATDPDAAGRNADARAAAPPCAASPDANPLKWIFTKTERLGSRATLGCLRPGRPRLCTWTPPKEDALPIYPLNASAYVAFARRDAAADTAADDSNDDGSSTSSEYIAPGQRALEAAAQAARDKALQVQIDKFMKTEDTSRYRLAKDERVARGEWNEAELGERRALFTPHQRQDMMRRLLQLEARSDQRNKKVAQMKVELGKKQREERAEQLERKLQGKNVRKRSVPARKRSAAG